MFDQIQRYGNQYANQELSNLLALVPEFSDIWHFIDVFVLFRSFRKKSKCQMALDLDMALTDASKLHKFGMIGHIITCSLK